MPYHKKSKPYYRNLNMNVTTLSPFKMLSRVLSSICKITYPIFFLEFRNIPCQPPTSHFVLTKRSSKKVNAIMIETVYINSKIQVVYYTYIKGIRAAKSTLDFCFTFVNI